MATGPATTLGNLIYTVSRLTASAEPPRTIVERVGDSLMAALDATSVGVAVKGHPALEQSGETAGPAPKFLFSRPLAVRDSLYGRSALRSRRHPARDAHCRLAHRPRRSRL